MTPPRTVRPSAASAGARVFLLAVASIAASAVVLSVFFAAAAACGTDVSLGGGDDAAAPVVDGTIVEIVDTCEPCSSSRTCATSASCVQIAGNLTFCATACPSRNECATDDICQPMAMGPGGPQTLACAPKAGACAPALPPRSESGVVDHCGNLEGPTTAAVCKSCDKDDKDCQKNGCYGGWWCNTTTVKCQRPPKACP